jgi:hypothetical protein
MIGSATIAYVAAGLLSEDAENSEYDRALVEMTAELLGLPITDNRDLVAAMLRGHRRNPCDECPACDYCGEDRAWWPLTETGACDDCLTKALQAEAQ